LRDWGGYASESAAVESPLRFAISRKSRQELRRSRHALLGLLVSLVAVLATGIPAAQTASRFLLPFAGGFGMPLLRCVAHKPDIMATKRLSRCKRFKT
jgi:hypothetical protein